MRRFLPLCAAVLLLGLADLPLGYDTLLRIVVTAGAVWLVAAESARGVNAWRVAFGLVAVVSNPVFPPSICTTRVSGRWRTSSRRPCS